MTKNHTTKKTALALGALGVVYGDIGTSPLYALNEIFFGHTHTEVTRDSVLGLISIVVWALITIIAIKYVTFVLRADNDGEGGVFALLALLKQHKKKSTLLFVTILTFAAGLLFGDGIITPAISVLSATEGLKVAKPALEPFIVPLTIVIITALFMVQRKGTSVIGKVFGPIILLWFGVLAVFGLRQILQTPEILQALNPIHAIKFIVDTRPYALLATLGSVMLVVTGGEALYADMGHFGRSPIRLSWFSVVMPALILNYLGQGAFLLSGQEVINENIFYSLVPSQILIPIILLATMATIIASQALISGAFSLSSQGIALGLLPRLRIKHTHKHHEGQIYLPTVNWALYVGCVVLVLAFKTSSNLANAYGLAVSLDMFITSLSVLLLARYTWKWRKWVAVSLFGAFAVVDLGFLTANSLKFLKGGWVPITIGLVIFGIMSTWQWGKKFVREAFATHSKRIMSELLIQKLSMPNSKNSLLVLTMHSPTQLTDKVPPLVEMYLKKFKHMPEHIVMLTVVQTRHPKEFNKHRLQITAFENNHEKDSSLITVTARFGFMETPNVEKIISLIAANEELTPDDDMHDWVIFAAREKIYVSGHRTTKLLLRFRARLFAGLVRNSTPAYDYYGLAKDSRLTLELVPVRIKG